MVLELFYQQARDHLGAEQVYRRLNKDASNISLASIYRALSQLTDARLLTDVTFADGRVVYALNEGNRHGHLMCISCGTIHEFSDTEIDALLQTIAENFAFTLSGRPLVLDGNCLECKKRGGRGPRTFVK